MCEYLCGSLRSARLTDATVREALKSEATARGCNIQFNEAIPEKMRKEIAQFIKHEAPFTLINITSNVKHDCIEEAFMRELDDVIKHPFEEVGVFNLLRRVFEVSQPVQAALIIVAGASMQWAPLPGYKMTLREFLWTVYEYRDLAGHDISGCYEILA